MAEQKQETSEQTRPVPSQAEGDEPTTPGSGTRPVPSQAEGDEQTVDEALRQRERK
jgi:hypothetical protein